MQPNSQAKSSPFLIVLLGGIASGKSKVSSYFEEEGAHVLAADPMVHELLCEDEVKEELRSCFGEVIFDSEGAIDRRKLASAVFGAGDLLKKLEQILHPRVRAKLDHAIAAIAAEGAPKVVILDVPLAAETGHCERADLVVFIDVDQETRIERASKNRGWSREDLLSRESHQMPLSEKRALATHIVRNSHSMEEAQEDVRRIWNEVIEPWLQKDRGRSPA